MSNVQSGRSAERSSEPESGQQALLAGVTGYLQQPDGDPGRYAASYSLGMPQMLFGGLSERWLFKESGDIHWRMICADLNVPSDRIAGRNGERLYASFVRVRMDSAAPFSEHVENARLGVQAQLARVGEASFVSELAYTGSAGTIQMVMASVFVAREAGNRRLARAQPERSGAAGHQAARAVPLFTREYQAVKRLRGDETNGNSGRPFLSLAGTSFHWTDDVLDCCRYVVNPYYDLNGAGLLYFASYPRIHDVCERAHLMARSGRRDVEGATGAPGDRAGDDHGLEPAFQLTPLARDVFYYGNAEAGDELELHLRCLEPAPGDRLRIWSTLYRKGGVAPLADIFTVKAFRQRGCLLQQVLTR